MADERRPCGVAPLQKPAAVLGSLGGQGNLSDDWSGFSSPTVRRGRSGIAGQVDGSGLSSPARPAGRSDSEPCRTTGRFPATRRTTATRLTSRPAPWHVSFCRIGKRSSGGSPASAFTSPTTKRSALRHRVIVRRITQGTRPSQGSRALALPASIIETCRKRNLLPWPYLAKVIAERRKGQPAPPIPAPLPAI